MERLPIKLFITTVLACVFSFTILLNLFTSNLPAEEKPEMIIGYLVNALRSINKPVCEKAADGLLPLSNDQSSYDLHLRNADLNYYEIKLIAEAIKIVHIEGGPSLQSFSMSYNPHLGDEGVLLLAKTLPATATEIGLVQCGIGDKGGDALIMWAAKALNHRWLCVEQNSFSAEMKDRFIQFGNDRKGLLIVL